MQRSLFSRQAADADWPRSAAQLRAGGVTRSVTATKRWRRSTYGHYTPAPSNGDTAQRVIDSSVTVPPGGALGGWAAAFVLGCDWLDGYTVTADLQPVPVCGGENVHRRSTPAVRYHRDRLGPDEVVRHHRLWVTTPLRTTFDAVRWAPDLTEAVVVLDAIAHFRLVDLVDLHPYVADRSRWAGVARVRAALSRVDAGVLSPWESRLRMVYTVEAGLPQPLVNPSLFDDRGRFVAMPDLLDPDAGLVLEYDGSGHRDRLQHNSDNRREESLEDLGLIVVRVDSHDYRSLRESLLRRIRSARARGLARDRSKDRWTVGAPTPYRSR